MKARPEISRNLRLEALETRTLLAADASDPFGLVADYNLAIEAVTAKGDFQASFSTNFGNHQLVITGTDNTALSIDMSKLPAFVTNLKLSSFDSVTISGTDHIENLILADIGSVAAQTLAIDGSVEAKDVGSLSLASVEGNLALVGPEMKLSIDRFGEISQTFSEIKTLTLTTSSSHIEIFAMPKTPEQTLIFTNVPASGFLHAWGYETVRIGLPPADTGNTGTGGSNGSGGTDSPSDNSGAGNNVDSPSEGTIITPPDESDHTANDSDTGPFVIVTHPLNEETRLYLEQLSRLLHSSQGDADAQALALLNRGIIDALPFSSPASGEIVNEAFPQLLPANQLNRDLVRGGALEKLSVDNIFPSSTYFEALPSWVNEATVANKYVELGRKLPDGLAQGNMPEVSITWPIFPATQESFHHSEARYQRAANSFNPPVHGTAQALGTYVIERVIAEFSPGQQSLVLLVDPQPTRSPIGSKKAAAPSSPEAIGFPIAVTEV